MALQIDKRAGHIPGARSGPWSAVLDDDTAFRDRPTELRDHYRRLGVDDEREVVAYCGSGVSACLNVLAMEHAGLRRASPVRRQLVGLVGRPEP